MNGKKQFLLPVAAVVFAIAAGTSYYWPERGNVQKIGAGQCLSIPVKELSQQARFYPVEVDGTKMEVLAVKDAAGKVRTAFNTCQVCYGSGRGVYTQQGNELVCGNCGNRFSVEQVEVEAGGCNPFPIFPEHKTETAESISIGYDFLKASSVLFARWK